MAKNKENKSVFDVSDLAMNAERNIAERENKAAEETVNTHNTHTQHTYTMPQEETRSKRIQIVVKPSVNAELDRLAKEGKIKSKNDLICFLVEQYISANK